MGDKLDVLPGCCSPACIPSPLARVEASNEAHEQLRADCETARQAWLAAVRQFGAHLDGCSACRYPRVECATGQAISADSEAAWSVYDAAAHAALTGGLP